MCGGGGGLPRCKVHGAGFPHLPAPPAVSSFPVFVASEFGWGVCCGPFVLRVSGCLPRSGFSAGSVNSILARAKEVMTGRKGRNPASLQAAGLPSEVVL